MNKKSPLSAFLAAILIGGLVLASAMRFGTVQASIGDSGIPKPSVPKFTLKYVDNSYDVPSSTTTTTDPYTGKQTVTTHPGYHIQNGTIEVTIKNQEFTPYSIDNQHTIYLFYNVSYKGRYEEEWMYYPSGMYARDSNAATRIPQSTSDYTVVQFSAPPEGEMDFRVQAQIGYYNGSQLFIVVPGAPFSIYTFIGEVSGWSSTQTLTIGESQTSTPSPATTPAPTPTPSQEPQQTEQIEPIIGTAIVVAVIIAVLGLFIYLIKRK